MRKWTIVVGALGMAVGAAAQAAPAPRQPEALKPPPAEVRAGDAPVALPAVPDFVLPAAPGDGSHTVRELRVSSARPLGSELAVHGFVTWAYDCATDVRKPKETDRQVRKRIDEDPTLCERPKFYVGDARDTPPEKSLWVVDVPRVYNKLEVERIQKADRTMPDRCEPNEKHPKQLVCPPYKVGDEVVIVGTFTTSSPHSERNSDGLLVYKAMKNVTQAWETTGGAAIPAAAATTVHAPPAPPPPLAAPGHTVDRKVVPEAKRTESFTHLSAGNKLAAQRKLSDAVDEYKLALAAWDGDHLAWYGMGGALAQSGDWDGAREAFEHAATLQPDAAMYEMWLGIAHYEAAVKGTRAAEAQRLGVRPEEVMVELSATDFTRAIQHLRQAVQLEPKLWRAQYYLGRSHRARGDAKEAASRFTRAIEANPREAGPYIALGELYRKWDYPEQAIEVTTQGTVNVPGAAEASDVWYVLGMGYDDKHVDDRAIEAFTKALETRADNAKARFQRGQAYFRKGDRAHAKEDLEAFVAAAATSPTSELAKQQASKMLMDLAAKSKH